MGSRSLKLIWPHRRILAYHEDCCAGDRMPRCSISNTVWTGDPSPAPGRLRLPGSSEAPDRAPRAVPPEMAKNKRRLMAPPAKSPLPDVSDSFTAIIRFRRADPGISRASNLQRCAFNLQLATCNLQLFQILVHGRMQQSLRCRIIEILGCDHRHSGIDSKLDGFSLQVLDHRLDSKIRHVERILHHYSVQLLCPHCIHELLGCVEAEKGHFACLAQVLQCQEHPRCRAFVDAEYSLNVAAESIKQIFRSLFRSVASR